MEQSLTRFAEKFEQAIQDFEAGLEHKLALLPTSSRQIAEAHYKLSMVLDLTSGRLSDAITHAEKALQSVESRLAELADGLAGKLPPLPEADTENRLCTCRMHWQRTRPVVREPVNLTRSEN